MINQSNHNYLNPTILHHFILSLKSLHHQQEIKKKNNRKLLNLFSVKIHYDDTTNKEDSGIHKNLDLTKRKNKKKDFFNTAKKSYFTNTENNGKFIPPKGYKSSNKEFSYNSDSSIYTQEILIDKARRKTFSLSKAKSKVIKHWFTKYQSKRFIHEDLCLGSFNDNNEKEDQDFAPSSFKAASVSASEQSSPGNKNIYTDLEEDNDLFINNDDIIIGLDGLQEVSNTDIQIHQDKEIHRNSLLKNLISSNKIALNNIEEEKDSNIENRFEDQETVEKLYGNEFSNPFILRRLDNELKSYNSDYKYLDRQIQINCDRLNQEDKIKKIINYQNFGQFPQIKQISNSNSGQKPNTPKNLNLLFSQPQSPKRLHKINNKIFSFVETNKINLSNTINNIYMIKNINENKDLIIYDNEENDGIDSSVDKEKELNDKCSYSLDDQSKIYYIRNSPPITSEINSFVHSNKISENKPTKNISDHSKMSPINKESTVIDHFTIYEKLKNLEKDRKQARECRQYKEYSSEGSHSSF